MSLVKRGTRQSVMVGEEALMTIDRDTVLHYAKLAKLELDEQETVDMQQALGSILDYVAQIATLDLDDVPATTHVFAHEPLVRSDEAKPGIGSRAALASAPDTEAGHFLVPKVIKVK